MDLIPHPLMAMPSLAGRRYSGLGPGSMSLNPMYTSPYGLLGGGMGPGMGLGMGMGMRDGMPPGLAMDPFGLLGLGGMGMGLGLGMGMGRSRRGLLDMPYSYGYCGRGSRYLDPCDLFDDMFDDDYLDDFSDIEDPLILYLRLQGRGRRRGRRNRYGGIGY